ncbi:hypothetical protein [Lysinibacillus sp. 3P01SB]|uniref:hypothetical protein n=1 Tax=Lysinibacillus sp. 3P01SB TaxID=3132284 RepID=UPI0039A545BF
MRLWWMEIKKCFTWPIVGLLLVMNVLLYSLLADFYFENFPNGRPSSERFEIELDMVERYGEVIDDGEIAEVRREYEQTVEKFEAILRDHPLSQTAGVETVEQYREYERDDEAFNKLEQAFWETDDFDLMWWIQSYESILENYQYKEESLQSPHYRSPLEKERIEELLANESYQYYSSSVAENFMTIAENVTIIILFNLIILLSPVFLRDRANQMVPLQYSTKHGRKTFVTKWRAGLMLTLFVTTILIVIYGMLYMGNGTSPFFFMQLYHMDYVNYWYDITFRQYIIFVIMGMYLISAVFGLLVMACSSLSRNYLSQMAAQIVIIGLFIWLVIPTALGRLFQTYHLPWVAPGIYAGLIGVTVVVVYWLLRHERVREIT